MEGCDDSFFSLTLHALFWFTQGVALMLTLRSSKYKELSSGTLRQCSYSTSSKSNTGSQGFMNVKKGGTIYKPLEISKLIVYSTEDYCLFGGKLRLIIVEDVVFQGTSFVKILLLLAFFLLFAL